MAKKNWCEIRKKASQYAEENMKNRGLNCAESVFDALIRSGALDMPQGEKAVSFATGFGSGGGGAGFTCGALASAILANSIAHGRKEPRPDERTELKEKHYRRYNNIVSDFVKMSGSGLCGEIINEFPEGYTDSAVRANCIRISAAAAGIAVDYLQMDAQEAAALEYDSSVVGIKNWL